MLKKVFQKIYRAVRRVGPRAAIVLVVVLIPAAFFLPALGTMIPPSGVFEQPAYLKTESLNDIKHDALYLPIRIVELAAAKIHPGVTSLRLVSAAIASLAALCFFLMARRWYTLRITVLATSMFLTSSFVLHAARFANVEVLNLLVIPGLMLIGSLLSTKAHDNKLILSIALLAAIFYIPGAWLFVIAGLIVYKSHMKAIWEKVSLRLRISGLFLLSAFLVPLVISFIHAPTKIIEWLGVSDYADLTVDTLFKNALAIPNQLFYHGPPDATAWLPGTPILDIFAIAMLILGFFAYRAGEHPDRERIVFSSFGIAVLLVVLGGPSRLGLMIPLLYIVIANGIGYMLQSWFTVFPRNPLARSIGLSLIFAAVIVSCSYQLGRYFVAWPQSPAIQQIIDSR